MKKLYRKFPNSSVIYSTTYDELVKNANESTLQSRRDKLSSEVDKEVSFYRDYCVHTWFYDPKLNVFVVEFNAGLRSTFGLKDSGFFIDTTDKLYVFDRPRLEIDVEEPRLRWVAGAYDKVLKELDKNDFSEYMASLAYNSYEDTFKSFGFDASDLLGIYDHIKMAYESIWGWCSIKLKGDSSVYWEDLGKNASYNLYSKFD